VNRIIIDKFYLEPTPSRRGDDDDGWSGSFITYFLLFTLFVVVGYLILHNKNKVNNDLFLKINSFSI
jgi:hypothetical protein